MTRRGFVTAWVVVLSLGGLGCDALDRPSSAPGDLQPLDPAAEKPPSDLKTEGMTEHRYRTGALRAKGYMKKGAEGFLVPEGPWEFFHENGQRAAKGAYEGARYEGPVTEQGVFLSGRQGPWTFWYRNGQVRSETVWEKGIKNGTFKTWYEDGTRQHELVYVNDRLEGPVKKWHENGQLALEGRYETDLPAAEWTHWQPDGTRREVDVYDAPGHGVATFYYPDGTREGTKEIDGGKENGTFLHHRPDGTREFRLTLVDGVKHGPAVTWHPNGKVEAKGEMKNGLQDGEWLTYDRKGKLVSRVEWKNGRPVVDEKKALRDPWAKAMKQYEAMQKKAAARVPPGKKP